MRKILRDEIPPNEPTHQDNRFHDLRRIGVEPIRILNTPPTAATKATLRRFDDLVRFPQNHLDLRVLVVLRILGEIMVAEMYRHVMTELSRRFGFKPEEQHFYAPHFWHDVKGGKGDHGGAGHTEEFETVIEELITDEATLAAAMEAAQAAADVRYAFHNQFLPKAAMWRATRRVAAIAAVLAVLAGGASWLIPTIEKASLGAERVRFETFMRAAEPQTREWFLEANLKIAERAARNGDLKDLARVGTFAAVHAWYGDGP